MSPRASAFAALVVAAVLLGAAPAAALPPVHGVDPVGRYLYKDSRDPTGAAPAPVAGGTPLAIADADAGEVEVALPFPFRFYDVNRTTLTVGVDGIVAFQAGRDLDGADGPLGDEPGPIAAPWWDDWVLGDEGEVRTRTLGPAADRTFAVIWRVRPAGSLESSDEYVEFQLLLRDRYDIVDFQYVETAGGDGSGATIGLRGRVDGPAFIYAQDEAAVEDDLAIRWRPAYCDAVRATRLGTFGPDTITGTPGRDVIVALAGGDQVDGRGGADIVCGSVGNDRIEGGIGDDRLLGEDGADHLLGESGHDRLRGGAGPDRCDEPHPTPVMSCRTTVIID